MLAAHDLDESLSASVLLENLACKATGALALEHLLGSTRLAPEDVEYAIGCGEEAVGDRYQRGGGNLGKAIAEQAGCSNASGCDVKAFCAGPVHALLVAASLVSAGVYEHVVVVAGGSLAKLGMKFAGALKNGVPVLEDVLAGLAVHVAPPGNGAPAVRLDAVGRHRIRSGSAQQAVLEDLVVEPLERLGRGILDVDRYATELHDPEITEPAGAGNVPSRNYRLIGALAVRRGELAREELDGFEREHGLPGFSPTQGHVASAIPYLPHALTGLRAGELGSAMLVAKGSLFLGRMTEQADGLSVLLEPGKEN
jgi:glycine/sarcosine/betaine reductase complex component C subunit beta